MAIHQHDCDMCTYLGSNESEQVDYYLCDKRKVGDTFPDFTLIARFGSEPEAYKSGAVFYPIDYDINTAGNLALDAKLITIEDLARHNHSVTRRSMIFQKEIKPTLH